MGGVAENEGFFASDEAGLVRKCRFQTGRGDIFKRLVDGMAKTKEKAPETAPEQEKAESPKADKPAKGNGPLLPLLTVLLAIVGVAELALWGYYGLGVVQDMSAARQREAERQARAEELAARGPVASSTYGPGLKVENGRVTWRWEDDLPTVSAPVEDGMETPFREDGLRLSRLPVHKIPYLLADQGAEPPAGGQDTV